jgi:uncharacterized protein YjbI with pentapeptide repeats
MEGASLVNAILIGASLFSAEMQGVQLGGSKLSAASLSRTQLQGAELSGVELTNAKLDGANLYRSFVMIDEYPETIFHAVNACPGLPRVMPNPGMYYWDCRSKTRDAKMLDAAGYDALVSRALQGIQSDEIKQVVAARLRPLDPANKPSEDQLVSDQPIDSKLDQIAKIRTQRAQASAQLMCDGDSAPYVARSLIYDGRIQDMRDSAAEPVDDPALLAIAALRGGTCPGAVGLDVNDFRELSGIEQQVLQARQKKRAKN